MARSFFLISASCKIAAVLFWWHVPLRPVAVALFFGPDLMALYQIFAPSARWLCPVITHFETERAEIWLTIDDGPDEEDTPRILELLDRHGARATFFLIGERVMRSPKIVAEIIRHGHDVGHHTSTHPAASFWCAGPARVRRELDDGLASLERAGAKPRWFRAPVGIKNLFLADALKERGLRCAAWSVRSYDTVARDPAAVADRVMRRVRPGSIVVMHEGAVLDPRVRVSAIKSLLEALSVEGIACVLPRAEQFR
jgi:peptidoglycan/xylan/chitin deacetylase (PgdA/CDA1 family)